MQAHEIKDIALLDLTGAGGPDLLDGITRISHVAAILVPESLLGKLMSIPMDRIAATVPIPDGKRVKVMSGQIVLSGESLSAPEADTDEIIVVAGQLVFTSPVQPLVRREIVAIGQVIAPAGSETGLGAALTRASGQVMYYPYTPGVNVKVHTGKLRLGPAELANSNGLPSDVLVVIGAVIITEATDTIGYQHIVSIGPVIAPKEAERALSGRVTGLGTGLLFYSAPPRMFEGKETFYNAFFELLDEPITLVLDGTFTFDEDVDPQVLKQKVHEIIFDGKLIASRKLVPMLQVLATQRDGRIINADQVDD